MRHPNDPSLTDAELRQAMAVGLVHLGLASPAQASRLAGLDDAAFARLLETSAAAGAYDIAAFEEDMATLASHEAS